MAKKSKTGVSRKPGKPKKAEGGPVKKALQQQGKFKKPAPTVTKVIGHE